MIISFTAEFFFDVSLAILNKGLGFYWPSVQTGVFGSPSFLVCLQQMFQFHIVEQEVDFVWDMDFGWEIDFVEFDIALEIPVIVFADLLGCQTQFLEFFQ